MNADLPIESPRLAKRVTLFLGLRRSVGALLVMLVLVMMGEQMFKRFLPEYLQSLGAGARIIGLMGFLDNMLNALYALPGGSLTDRLGHRRSLALFAGMNVVGFAFLAIPFWPAVLAGVFFCTAWSQLSLPATFSLISHQLPKEKRVMGLGVQAIIRRVPMALGPVIGGAIFYRSGIVAGMRWVLVLALALTGLAVAIHLWLASREETSSRYAPIMPWGLWRTFRPQLRRLLLSDILIRFCEQIPAQFVILWVLLHGRSELEFGWLSAIEMATAAALYIPVAWWIDRHVRAAEASRGAGADPGLPITERGPFILATFCFFALFPVALFFSVGWWALVGTFILRGLKEFGEPARKATIVDLAAEGLKARTVGLYYFLRDSTVSFAALMGGFLWARSPALNLWTAFGFGVLGILAFAWGARKR
ncbi:MAG: MFS transporter [Candidatus Sumerlaeota bacterium]|nr:MFS transporter [Candidatus Sumerlaeota bacterium]